MRITKLHLLLFFLLAGAGIYGAYFWKKATMEPEHPAPAVTETPAQKYEPPPVTQPPPMPVQKEPPQKPSPQSVTYTVQHGDTLWKIAKMESHFGKGHRWYDIWKANEDKIFDFDRLVQGQEITIPMDKPEGYAWPKTNENRKQNILRRAERQLKPQS